MQGHRERAQRGVVRERKRSLTVALLASAVIAVAGSAIGPKAPTTPAGQGGQAQQAPSDASVSPLRAIGRKVQQVVPKGSFAARVLSATETPEPQAAQADPDPSAPQTCPGPQTCVRFGYSEGKAAKDSPRWPFSGGVASVGYKINPTGALTDLTSEQVVQAIRSGFETWNRSVPSVRFVYEGVTNRAPIRDGENVVGFTSLRPDQTLGHAEVVHDSDGIVEADMELATPQTQAAAGATIFGWTWDPCGDSEPCTAVQRCDLNVAGVRRCYNDLQNVVTHEAGHWLWLADLKAADAVEMTMFWSVDRSGSNGPIAERKKSTLALGDIVAARALYPCDCQPPSISAP